MSRPLDIIEEVTDRLEHVWDAMVPEIWTDDPEYRRLGGPIEAICQDVYFALETLRAATPGEGPELTGEGER